MHYFLIGNDTFFPLFFEHSIVQTTGIILLILSFIWTFIAQIQMKDSWRIGIDTENKTALIVHGIFSVSRNPIFLGMLTSLTGLLLIQPNACTLLFLILSYILIQIQIRLEEDFLEKEHGLTYLNYKRKVRRLL